MNFKWVHDDADEKSGWATFGGSETPIKMLSFADAFLIDKIINESYTTGIKVGANRMVRSVESAYLNL